MTKGGGQMINCEDYRSQLTDYVNGNLTEAQAADIKSHLHICVDCTEIVDYLLDEMKVRKEEEK
jgi:anti-sigma factor RsiW